MEISIRNLAPENHLLFTQLNNYGTRTYSKIHQ
jgi:hypothetical protein